MLGSPHGSIKRRGGAADPPGLAIASAERRKVFRMRLPYSASSASLVRRRHRVRNVAVGWASLVLLAVVVSGCSGDRTGPEVGHDGLEYVTPEDVGWSSEELAAAGEFAAQSGYAAVMAVYDGKVFFSWGEVSRNFQCHSIRKPFLSALYGIQAARGELRLDATLADLGIDDIPPSLTPEEKRATVQHLLQSRSGVYHEAAAELDTIAAQRPARGSHPPGTFFYYNNWDFNALGTIFRRETGRDIFDTFYSQVALPIGMQDFDTANCSYEYEYEKSLHPAYKFRMSARDMARFGVLFQKNGAWLGRQIVPATWIEESTRVHSVVDSILGIGYGYMWNVIPEGSPFAAILGSSGYYHTGIGVHALIVLPSLRLVIVERYDTDVPWVDPGEAGIQLGLMIIGARIESP